MDSINKYLHSHFGFAEQAMEEYIFEKAKTSKSFKTLKEDLMAYIPGTNIEKRKFLSELYHKIPRQKKEKKTNDNTITTAQLLNQQFALVQPSPENEIVDLTGT